MNSRDYNPHARKVKRAPIPAACRTLAAIRR